MRRYIITPKQTCKTDVWLQTILYFTVTDDHVRYEADAYDSISVSAKKNNHLLSIV